MKILVY